MEDTVRSKIIEEMNHRGEFHVGSSEGIGGDEYCSLDLDGLVVLLVLPKLHGWRVPNCRTHGSLPHQIKVEDVAEAYDANRKPREIAVVSLDWGTWEPIWVRDGCESNAEKRGWNR